MINFFSIIFIPTVVITLMLLLLWEYIKYKWNTNDETTRNKRRT